MESLKAIFKFNYLSLVNKTEVDIGGYSLSEVGIKSIFW